MTLRLTLTDTDRDAVRALRHDRTIRPAERDRVETALTALLGEDRAWTAAQLGRAA